MAIRSQPPQQYARAPSRASDLELELKTLQERRAVLELERERLNVGAQEKQLLESQARSRKLAELFEDSPYPSEADGVDFDQVASAKQLFESRALYEAYGSYDYLDLIGPGGYASTWGQPLGYGMQAYLNPLSTRVDRAQGRDRPFVITEVDLGFIRGIARIVCEINCPAKGAIRSLVNYTVGGRGFQYTVATKNQQRKPPDGLIEAVQEVVDEFLERVKWCGALGKEGELVRRWFRDGEYFLQAHCDRVGRTDLRFVEPEQITELGAQHWNRESMAEYGLEIGEADVDITFGVLTPKHDVNVRWGYNAWYDDLGECELLPADTLQHFKISDTNIKRGISDFYGAAKWLQRSDNLLTKTAGGAAIQAAIAGIRKHAAGVTQSDVSAFRASKTDYTTTAYMPGGGTRQFNNYAYPDGTILDIPFGLDWDQPPQGADRGPAFVEVAQAMLRWVATQWSMPEFLISSDASNANFSSTLVSESPFVKNIQGLQFGFGSQWHDLLWRVIYNAARYGRFDRFSEAGGYYAIRKLLKLHISFPTIETRDRNQETQRLKTLSDDGVISLETRAAEEGFDLAEEQAKGAKQRPAEITAKADGMDAGGGVTSLAGTEEAKRKPGEPGQGKPEQPTSEPDVKQEQAEGGAAGQGGQQPAPQPAQKPVQQHESAPANEARDQNGKWTGSGSAQPIEHHDDQSLSSLRQQIANFPAGPRKEEATEALKPSKYDVVLHTKDDAGKLAGVASVWKQPDTENRVLEFPPGQYVRIRNLAAAKRGEGQKILGAVLSYAEKHNAGVSLNSLEGAEPFYEKQGFHRGAGANYYLTADEVKSKALHESAPILESASLFESAEHAPKGGATIGGKKFEGGQFIPAKDMAKATPAEKHALKAKQEADKADRAVKQEQQAKAPSREPKYQQKLPGIPNQDDRGNKLLFKGAPVHRGRPDVNAIAMKERAAKIGRQYPSRPEAGPQSKPIPDDLDRRIHSNLLRQLRSPTLSRQLRDISEQRLRELENEYDFKAFGAGKDEAGNKLLFAGGPISRSHEMPADDRQKYEAAWDQAHSFATSGTGTGAGTENERQEATKTLNALHDKYGDAADALNEMLAARKEGPTSEIEDEYGDLYNDWARNNSTAAQRNRLDELEQIYGDGAFESIRDEIDPQVRREKQGPNDQELEQYRRAWARYGSTSGVVEDLENKYGKDAFQDVRDEVDNDRLPEDEDGVQSHFGTPEMDDEQEQEARDKAEQEFGDKDPEFFADLAGMDRQTLVEDPVVEVSDVHKWEPRYTDDYPIAAVGQDISVSHPYLNDCKEFVGVDKDGQKMLQIGLVVVRRPPAPPGFGAQMFGAQVEAARKQGLDYITLHAAGSASRGMNGYYTWPRFGFDQDIETLESEKIKETVHKKFPNAKTVLDVFASPGGAEWWKTYGGDMHNARFDLHDGSRSLQVWKAYQEAKKQVHSLVAAGGANAV